MQPAPDDDQACLGEVSGALAGRFVGCSTQDGRACGLRTRDAALRNSGSLDQQLGGAMVSGHRVLHLRATCAANWQAQGGGQGPVPGDFISIPSYASHYASAKYPQLSTSAVPWPSAAPCELQQLIPGCQQVSSVAHKALHRGEGKRVARQRCQRALLPAAGTSRRRCRRLPPLPAPPAALW
jgi:hypothetical protein